MIFSVTYGMSGLGCGIVLQDRMIGSRGTMRSILPSFLDFRKFGFQPVSTKQVHNLCKETSEKKTRRFRAWLEGVSFEFTSKTYFAFTGASVDLETDLCSSVAGLCAAAPL